MIRIRIGGLFASPLPGRLSTYRNAVLDARKEIPHGDEPVEWIHSVHRACSSWAEGRAARWCEADRPLLTRWQSLQRAYAHAADELARLRQEEVQAAAERSARGPLGHHEQNPLGEPLSTGWYAAAMALLTCLELPLVFLSFTAFGLSPINTGLLSLLCAAITAALGNSLGTVARHVRMRGRTMLALLLGLSAAFAGSLAWLREGALEVIRSETATLDPRAAAWALFAISVASLAVASILAWHHAVDPADQGVHRARLARRRWERRVERLRRELSRAETGRLAAREVARQEVLAAGEAMLALFHRYARWNRLHRDKHDLPPGLWDERLPRLEMPSVLARPLVWTTQGEADAGPVLSIAPPSSDLTM